MGHCSKAPLGYRLVETKRFTGLPGGAEAPGGGNWATIVPGSPPVRVSTFPIASSALKTCWTAPVSDGLSQQSRLPLTEEDGARACERRDALFAEAERLDFQTVPAPPKAPRYLEEMRPGQTELIKNILSVGDDASLGAFVYGLFSAVAHGTTFGLTSSVTADAPNLPRTPGLTWGAVYTSSLSVVSAVTAVILGTAEAYRRRNKLFGWASQSWNETCLRAIQAAKRSFPSTETT